MNAEQLNQKLYEKLEAEQAAYRQKLMALTPAEILCKAYEYAMREEIVYAMGVYDLSPKQCRALLKTERPVADIFRLFEKCDATIMEVFRDTAENLASELIRAQKKQEQSR